MVCLFPSCINYKKKTSLTLTKMAHLKHLPLYTSSENLIPRPCLILRTSLSMVKVSMSKWAFSRTVPPGVSYIPDKFRKKKSIKRHNNTNQNSRSKNNMQPLSTKIYFCFKSQKRMSVQHCHYFTSLHNTLFCCNYRTLIFQDYLQVY